MQPNKKTSKMGAHSLLTSKSSLRVYRNSQKNGKENPNNLIISLYYSVEFYPHINPMSFR